jgi:hypothetical protein
MGYVVGLAARGSVTVEVYIIDLLTNLVAGRERRQR